MLTLTIDRAIFSDETISKAVYWETNQYNVTRQLNGNAESISFEPKPNCQEDENALKERFLSRLNDFKVQQIVDNEMPGVFVRQKKIPGWNNPLVHILSS